MNFDFRALLTELSSASLRTKALAVVLLVCVVAVVSVASVVSARPHFVTLYAGLDDAERVAVEKALAGGGVRFRTSNYPGPYVIYVDEGQFDRAQIQVALAEVAADVRAGRVPDHEAAVDAVVIRIVNLRYHHLPAAQRDKLVVQLHGLLHNDPRFRARLDDMIANAP